MPKQIPHFDYSRCIKCGQCALWCPVNYLSMTLSDPKDPENPFPERTGDVCLGCGQCSKECAVGAITMGPPV